MATREAEALIIQQNDVLAGMHPGPWYTYTDWNDQTHANLRVNTEAKNGKYKDITLPTEAELSAEIARQQAEADSLIYTRNRINEYPYWGTQLDKIYHDGIDKWKSEMIDPIKAKYPKDNSGPIE